MHKNNINEEKEDEVMQMVSEAIICDMKDRLDDDFIKEMREIVENEMRGKIEALSDDEVRERVLKYANKCDGVSFTPYIDARVQKYFFCKFEGLVEVCEKSEKEGNIKRFHFSKWYKQDGVSYSIDWLTIAVIEKMMRRSVSVGCNLIMEMIKNIGKE